MLLSPTFRLWKCALILERFGTGQICTGLRDIASTEFILNIYVNDLLIEHHNPQALLLTSNIEQLHSLFASIPCDWYRKNHLAEYEGYYASIVYYDFAALGLDVRPEETTNKGRMDLVVYFEDRIYVIEFKVLELNRPGPGPGSSPGVIQRNSQTGKCI